MPHNIDTQGSVEGQIERGEVSGTCNIYKLKCGEERAPKKEGEADY